MQVIGPHLQRAAEFEAVLRSLPEWFGIEESLLEYAKDTERLPTFALEDGGQVCGFLTLREHFPESWEIHCMAIRRDARRLKAGTRLLAHAEAWVRGHGAKLLQVKTVAPTSRDDGYAETRKFYEAMGFSRVEVFPELWDPWNPALQYIKLINAA